MIIKLDLKKVFDDFYSQIGHLHDEKDITYANILNTTAQTLSGAINEHEQVINDIQEYIKKLTSVTIDNGSISTIDQDYILIDKVNVDFTASCCIEVNPFSENGLISLGAIRSLPDNTAIDNIAGINVQIKLTSNELFTFLDNFNDNSHIILNNNHQYKFVLERKEHLYTGSIYDITTGNLCISKSITNNTNFEYIVIWGTGTISFSYSNVQLNADYLLKTKNQTLVGAINELYDDQEYTLINLTNQVNGL